MELLSSVHCSEFETLINHSKACFASSISANCPGFLALCLKSRITYYIVPESNGSYSLGATVFYSSAILGSPKGHQSVLALRETKSVKEVWCECGFVI